MASCFSFLDTLEEKPQIHLKTYHFEAEIQKMMFACGDSSKPSLESAHLIERIVHQQLISVLLQAQEVAEMREAKYIQAEDILFLLRKDKMKLRRAIKFLCYSDMRQNLYNVSSSTSVDNMVNVGVSGGGKRRQMCRDFLLSMDSTGQLLSWVDDETVHDEVKEDRMLRADEQTTAMDSEDYLAFAHARGQSFTQSSNTHSIKLRALIFSEGQFLGDSSRPQLPAGHGVHMEMLGYVAYETLAQIIDFALLVRRDETALSSDPINKLMPPSLYTPAVVTNERWQQNGSDEPRPEIRKLEGTTALTPDEIREAVRRYWSPITAFSSFFRNMQPNMERQLFCK